MNLRRISKHFDSEEFERLDPVTRIWGNPFVGRLAVTDRFLSNFNRPTRKRMLYTDFDSDLEQFDVIRHIVTGDVYLIGVARKDTFKLAKTTQLLICHMVTPNGLSAGLAEVIRPEVNGSGDDLGWVTMTPVGTAYVDLELRATSAEPGSKDVHIGSYYAWTESHWPFKDGDKFVVNGQHYIVEETAYDAEIQHLRVISRDQNYTNAVFDLGAVSKVFDPVTRRFVETVGTRNVSGLLTNLHNSNDGYERDAADYAELRINLNHIGFEPKPGMKVQLAVNDKFYTVSYVGQSEHRKQWVVRLR
jgi:hypothetical protein